MSSPKFIRKNGKIIPIKSDGKTSRKKGKADPNAAFKRDVKAAKVAKTAGAVGGAVLGAKVMFKSRQSMVAGLLGATGGAILGKTLGKEIGITAGSIVTRRHGEKRKTVAKRAANRADRIRAALAKTSV